MDETPAALDAPPERADVAVVGAGILGLAVARELTRRLRRPGLRVAVLEREDDVAAHQTGHNSGVVHAGIYYAPGSLKARLCVEGARELYAYCEERGIAHGRCGKLIVATERSELAGLDELERRGLANGVAGLARLDADGIQAIEPHARGIAGLHSPATGIADFAAVARALAGDVRAAGGTVTAGCEVTALAETPSGVLIHHEQGTLEASHAIACAGAWADRLAVRSGAGRDPRIVPFRGAYLRLRPERRHLVRGLIYPVADPALPFLGVHLTRHVSGDVLVGPTALLAAARDGYSATTIRPRDVLDTLAWPGTWRMARRWWRTGTVELRHAASRRAFVAAAARFVPELEPGDVEPAFAGVRAQALARDGRLVDEFAFSGTARTLHVRNAPSPGATSSLAIARHVAAQAAERFGL
jgi:L-2-hydroxyglutarate oxidase